ncbi:hypothetical protein ACHAPU_010904, partial [Fusarium lateritium]
CLQLSGLDRLPFSSIASSEPSSFTLLHSRPCADRSNESRPSKRRRVGPTTDQQINGEAGSNTNLVVNSTAPQEDDLNSASEANTDHENTPLFGDLRLPPFPIDPTICHAYPQAINLPLVFNQDLATSIVQHNYKSSLLLWLPTPPQCKIVMDIDSVSLAYLALKFYNVQIKEIGQQRAIGNEAGMRMRIAGTITLEGTHINGWDTFLGELVSNGVRQCHQRLEEVKRGMMLSYCLALDIPGEVDCPGRLIVDIDAITSNVIFSSLW